MGKGINSHNILFGKPEEQKQLGRPRSICKDNIRIDLTEIGCGGVDWIHLNEDRDQRRVLNIVMNLQLP